MSLNCLRRKLILGLAVLAAGAPAILPVSVADASKPVNVSLVGKSGQNNSYYFVGSGGSAFQAFDNSSTVNNVNFGSSDNYRLAVYSGYDDTKGCKVEGNTVYIMESTASGDTVKGGWVGYTDEAQLKGTGYVAFMTSSDKPLRTDLIAGHSNAGEVSGNVVNITGGRVVGNVILAESNLYTVENEKAVLSPDTVDRLKDNVMVLTGSPDLSEARLYGAAIVDNTDSTKLYPIMVAQGTNNTLAAGVLNVSVKSIEGFNEILFSLDKTIKNGSVMLNVNNAADISKNFVMAYVSGDCVLNVGDEVTLINDGNTGNSSIESQAADYEPYTENVTAGYDIAMGKAADVKKTVQNSGLLMNSSTDRDDIILKLSGKTVRQQVQNMLMVPKLQQVNRSADLLLGDGYREAIRAAGQDEYMPFFAGSRTWYTYSVSDGLHLNSTNLVFGMAREYHKADGTRVLVAPFAEYGRGGFTGTTLGTIHGDGHLDNVGGGILYHENRVDGHYWEASLRGGRVRGDYQGHDFLVFGNKVSENFGSRTCYYGAHLGYGLREKLSEKSEREYYGQLLYTYIGRDTVKLPTGEEYNFNRKNSERLRIGYRYNHNDSSTNSWYAGFGLDYEFDGRTSGSWQDCELPGYTYKGLSGFAELGCRFRPDEDNKNLYMDASLQGGLGKMKGAGVKLSVNWTF